MERKTFTMGGGAFSSPDPLSSATFAKLKQEAVPYLRKLGAKDNELNDTQAYLQWMVQFLTEKEYDASLVILTAILRPESGVSVLDAFEADTKNEVKDIMLFFSANLAALLPPKTKSVPASRNSPAKTRKRKR